MTLAIGLSLVAASRFVVAMKSRVRFSQRWLPLRFGSLNAAVTLLQVPALARGFDWSGPYTVARVVTLACCISCGLIAVNLPIQLVALLTAKRRALRWIAGSLVLLLHTLAVAHRVRAREGLDLRALLSNVDFSWEAYGVAYDRLSPAILVVGVGLFAALVILEIQGKPAMYPQLAPGWRRALGCIVGYCCCVVQTVPTFDELSRALQASYQSRLRARADKVVLLPGDYPLVRSATVRPVASQRRPDVFLLLVESLRAQHVERRAPNGKAYTPYFNQLIERGLYVENFYGNSIQTRKGHFAALCSLIPSIAASEFDKFGKNHYDCLPRVLSREGYDTTFFQAYRKLSYDRTGAFMSRQGFAHVESVERFTQPEDADFTWAWGLQDDRFYRRFFEYLDTRDPGDEKPRFVTLAPIGNHMRFNKVPNDRQYIHPDAANIYERYGNSVYLADLGLKEFFAQLERRPRYRDAVVIVTGDHSYPLGEHGLEMNTDAAYEEFFRVPLLLLWPGVVKPEKIREIPYSQLDIAPTILDLVGARCERTHFMGVSLFAPRTIRAIPLVQPYSGVHLAVVEYPYKYVFHVASGGTKLFDLRNDPGESRDLSHRLDYAAIKARMHRSLRPTFLVQAALESDQIWPATAEESLAREP